jgi:hypothetical protein
MRSSKLTSWIVPVLLVLAIPPVPAIAAQPVTASSVMHITKLFMLNISFIYLTSSSSAHLYSTQRARHLYVTAPNLEEARGTPSRVEPRIAVSARSHACGRLAHDR